MNTNLHVLAFEVNNKIAFYRSVLIGMESHSVEMSALGRQCHSGVWPRVVCPTTETEYYISLHTHCVIHTCMSTLHTHVYEYCPTADVFYLRAGNAAPQWSGDGCYATGRGGSSLSIFVFCIFVFLYFCILYFLHWG